MMIDGYKMNYDYDYNDYDYNDYDYEYYSHIFN